MKRALVAAALLLGCVACQDSAPTSTVEQQLDQIESTLDNVESDLAGD